MCRTIRYFFVFIFDSTSSKSHHTSQKINKKVYCPVTDRQPLILSLIFIFECSYIAKNIKTIICVLEKSLFNYIAVVNKITNKKKRKRYDDVHCLQNISLFIRNRLLFMDFFCDYNFHLRIPT